MAALIKTLAGYVDEAPDWLKAAFVLSMAAQTILSVADFALWVVKKYYHL